jgi:hypothetical protein
MAPVNAPGASWGTLSPMPSRTRCEYAPENFFGIDTSVRGGPVEVAANCDRRHRDHGTFEQPGFQVFGIGRARRSGPLDGRITAASTAGKQPGDIQAESVETPRSGLGWRCRLAQT